MEESASHEQAKDLAELKKQHAVLEERMNTKQAETESALDRLRADMADWKTDMQADMARRDADMAKRDTDMARRDKDNLRWQIGLWVAAVVILGVIIRWPSVPAITG